MDIRSVTGGWLEREQRARVSRCPGSFEHVDWRVDLLEPHDWGSQFHFGSVLGVEGSEVETT